VLLQARFCGLKQNDQASTTLWQSTIAGGKHALIAVGESQTFFEGCRLQDCSQDCVMGTQKVRVNLTDTTIINCRGPAIDMSDESSVVMKQVDVVNCEGGVFLWHKASCEVREGGEDALGGQVYGRVRGWLVHRTVWTQHRMYLHSQMARERGMQQAAAQRLPGASRTIDSQ